MDRMALQMVQLEERPPQERDIGAEEMGNATLLSGGRALQTEQITEDACRLRKRVHYMVRVSMFSAEK